MKKNLIIYMTLLRILVLIFLIKEIFTNYLVSILYGVILLVFIIGLFKNMNNNKLKYLYNFENLIYLLIFTYEFNLLYTNSPYWDTGMHALTGYLAVLFIYTFFIYLKRINKFKKIYPFLITLVGFCFSITVGFMWEILEYSVDKVLIQDNQRDYLVNEIASYKFSKNGLKTERIYNIYETIIYYKEKDMVKTLKINDGYLDIGINDTMKDLYVNLIGSVMGSCFVYLILKEKDI
ncbi:MAG: hypothetical protein IJ501_06870 [Bacilli bacterium]|nr:hypothetical protein [Bacilli bacterium]